MRTIKVLAVLGLAVALVVVPALAQGQQQQPTATIRVQCAGTPAVPSVDNKEVKIKRGETVAWSFVNTGANALSTCVSGVQSARITFSGTPPNTPFAAQQPPVQVAPGVYVINIPAGQNITSPLFTVRTDASVGNYPYKIEFFNVPAANITPQTSPIPNTTINGTTTIIQVTPTLTEWGLIALAVLLMGGMGYMLYRRRPALRPAAP